MSIGAQRDMTLRTKRSKRGTDSPSMRQSQRIKMPHNSVFVLGPRTNREWLHGVRADKRPAVEKTDDEKAFGGERISITFRQIGTFINKTEKTIWGSGAKSKTRSEARKICVCDNAQMESMINAFGKENHDTNFDWDAEYGPGFDVINLVDAQAKLTLCSDQVANIRVQLCLYEKSIPFTVIGQQTSQPEQPKDLKTRFHPWTHGLTNSENPLFRDIDQDGSPQEGDLSIMFYLEKRYPFGIQGESASSQPENKSGLMIRTSQANELLFLWREMIDSQGRSSPPTHRYNLERPTTPDTPLHEEFHKSLKEWEARAGEAEYIAGNQWSIIDCAFWPVLNYIIANFDGLKGKRYPKLLAYHKRVLERDSAKTILAKGL